MKSKLRHWCQQHSLACMRVAIVVLAIPWVAWALWAALKEVLSDIACAWETGDPDSDA